MKIKKLIAEFIKFCIKEVKNLKISKKQTAILLLITVALIIAVSFGINNWSKSKSKNIGSASKKITANNEESKKQVSNANTNDTKPSTTNPDSQKAATPGNSSTGSGSSTTTTSTKGAGSTSSSTKPAPAPKPAPTPAPAPATKPTPKPTPSYTPSYQLREDLATEIYNAINKYRQENGLSVFTRVSTYDTFATQYLSYLIDGQPKPDMAGHAADYSTSEGSWDVEDLVPIIGGADRWHGGTSVSVKVAQKGDNYYICFATYAVKE